MTAIATRLKVEADNEFALLPRDYPIIMKYMGSKTGIIGFVADALKSAYRGGVVCDLFAGSASLSGALGHLVPIHSNDVQAYSAVAAGAYLNPISPALRTMSSEDLLLMASEIVERNRKSLPTGLEYPVAPDDIEAFNEIEVRNRALIDLEFDSGHHLFLKSYSGTWWSSEQCLWIDALREVADRLLAGNLITDADHGFLLACALYAMSYCSQGTGHFAQYRDAKTESAMKDIGKFRVRSFATYFAKKFDSLRSWNIANVTPMFPHRTTTLDFVDCLDTLSGGTVYADPPYNFVHYSRFYHAAETFVRYDYPTLQVIGGKVVKGRYREGRHQSPFCIRTQAPGAFAALFGRVADRRANLVLSYSDNGLLPLEQVLEIARREMAPRYAIEVRRTGHTHMTMGRSDSRSNEVDEIAVVAVRR